MLGYIDQSDEIYQTIQLIKRSYLTQLNTTCPELGTAKGRFPKGYLGIFPKLLSPPPPLGTLGITVIWEKTLFSKRPPCSLIWEKLQLKKEIV